MTPQEAMRLLGELYTSAENNDDDALRLSAEEMAAVKLAAEVLARETLVQEVIRLYLEWVGALRPDDALRKLSMALSKLAEPKHG